MTDLRAWAEKFVKRVDDWSGSNMDVVATLESAARQLVDEIIEEYRRDAERLDWFEQESKRGGCPALINDDNGRWAVSESGMQNVPDPSGPIDIATTFFVEAAEWKPTVREAIDAAIRQLKGTP